MRSAEYDALVAAGSRALVGLDFDGTLAPIVPDPTQARIHPDAPGALADLAQVVGTLAIITGRPVRQVLDLGGLADLPGELLVLGQYGNERWSSTTGEVTSPEPPAGLADLRAELPAILREAGVEDAFVEEKGLAVAVHTRRCPDPEAALSALSEPLAAAAQRHDLAVEPGRLVLEVRAPGMDKGHALQDLVAERSPSGVVFVGDDLGDLAAFEVVGRLRATGLPGYLVCSGSAEQQALAEHADEVVDGPDGVMQFLRRLGADVPAG